MKSATPSPRPSPDPKSRVFKPRTPVGLIISLIVGFTLLLVGIFYAINQLQRDFTTARMPGIIVEKTFVPAPRQEVILDNRGNMQVRQREGDFSLTVRVELENGGSRDFNVTNVPKAMFESVEVGQRFDVGPYLLPESATQDQASPTPEADSNATEDPAPPMAAPAETPAAEPFPEPPAAQSSSTDS
jgi:hypothetical protein